MTAGVLKRRWVMGQSMKFVTAIIKPIRLDDVLETLARVGIHAFTVTETKDYGQSGSTEIYRGLQYTPKFLPMLKIEAAIPSDRFEHVSDAIARAAKTGQANDGTIFVFELEHATHLRMGEVEKGGRQIGPPPSRMSDIGTGRGRGPLGSPGSFGDPFATGFRPARPPSARVAMQGGSRRAADLTSSRPRRWARDPAGC